MPKQAETAELIVNGKIFESWESVVVRKDYSASTSTFSFTAADLGDVGKGWDKLALRPGDEVKIKLAGEEVINGWITTRQTGIVAQAKQIIVQGFSYTGHIVTSSVDPEKHSQFQNYTFEAIAKSVLADFPFQFVMRNAPPGVSRPFKNVIPQYGETVWSLLERLGRMRGLTFMDDAQGNLVATQSDPSVAPTAEIEEGRNVLTMRTVLDDQTLLSRYQAGGQNTGDDNNWPSRDHAASVDIPGGKPWRKRFFPAEHPGDGEDLKDRVNLEVSRSLWPSVQCAATVQGWQKDDGSLWALTENISVVSPSCFPNETGRMTLGVQAITFQQDNASGTTTTLEMVLPSALSIKRDTYGPGAAPTLLNNPAPEDAKIEPPDTSVRGPR